MSSTIPVIDTLRRAGIIKPDRSEIISKHCRDIDVPVFRDLGSGVIYVDPNFQSRSIEYYEEKVTPTTRHPRNDMDWADARRRANYLAPFVASKRWLDFGCGPGYQLRESSSLASAHLGIEINKNNRKFLQQDGFDVSASLNDLKEFSPEVVSLFHVLEHLEDPVSTLDEIRDSCTQDAVLLVEVPHAHDTLLLNENEAFKNFTLWSEHLVLHTRQSLAFIVEQAGWQVKEIIGIQRYPVWNHVTWIASGKPSGLKSSLLDPTANQLHGAYEAYLAARDMTDTLVAFAVQPQGKS